MQRIVQGNDNKKCPHFFQAARKGPHQHLIYFVKGFEGSGTKGKKSRKDRQAVPDFCFNCIFDGCWKLNLGPLHCHLSSLHGGGGCHHPGHCLLSLTVQLCLRSHCVDQFGLRLTEICFPLWRLKIWTTMPSETFRKIKISVSYKILRESLNFEDK